MQLQWNEPGVELYRSVPAAEVPWAPFELRPDQDRQAEEYGLVTATDWTPVGVARRYGFSEDARPVYRVRDGRWDGALLALVLHVGRRPTFRVDQMPDGFRPITLQFPLPPEPVAADEIAVPAKPRDLAFGREIQGRISATAGGRELWIRRSDSSYAIVRRDGRRETVLRDNLSLREARIAAGVLLAWPTCVGQELDRPLRLAILQAICRRPLVRVAVGRLDPDTYQPLWYAALAEQAGEVLLVPTRLGTEVLRRDGTRLTAWPTLEAARRAAGVR